MGFRVPQGTVLTQALSDIDLAAERAKLQFEKPDKQLPQYVTGARAVLLVNGKPVGAAFDVSYNVSTQFTEIRTIAQFLPWELVPGQMMIKASLKRVMNPDRTFGGDGLYSTIQAVLHQPYSSLEVRDRLGNLLFYAKGMFSDIQGSITSNQLGVESIQFIGYYWRENVSQEYEPEGKTPGQAFQERFTKNSLVKRISGF